jgi:type IV pilus assembly protein PilY1
MHQTFTNLKTNKTTNVNATHSIGVFLGGTGKQSLANVAMYGSFNKTSGWPDSLTGYPAGICDADDCGSDGKGSSCTPLPTSTPDWDNESPKDVPDTFHSATNASEIKTSIKNAILDMLRRTSSGTAVSVLSSSEGSGANLMQALFYPKRAFTGGIEVSWISDLMNYWYYMDPYFTSANIREDTIREGTDYTLLDLKQDYIATIAYDATEEKTNAYRSQDINGNGSSLIDKGKTQIENTAAIWRAGFNLWWTDPAVRRIYTSLTPPALIPFDTTQTAVLDDYLGKTSSAAAANATINYVRGYDCTDASGSPGDCGTTYPNLIGRSRTVSSGVCAARKSPCSSDADCPSGDTCSATPETHVWKLGDIISSTPRIMGPANLNNFNLASPFGYNDQSYKSYIKSDDYQNRQLVFVGANDGMLHAFKLGKLLQKWTGKNWYEAAKQEGITGAGGIGSEAYAFIPKNVLPYLQYLQDNDYCHVYMVDGPTALSDVAINKSSTCNQADYWNCPKVTTIIDTNDLDLAKTSWRATLVGSVGIGGATCNESTSDADKVPAPLSVDGQSVGWSSYFALDVTDQTTPELLWEFSHPDLGVTNVGSMTVKVGGSDKRCAISNDVCTSNADCVEKTDVKGQCVTTNGRWFTILVSGSTGPIVNKEFKGYSDQNLKIFVLDHKTGTLLQIIDTGITNAFAGSLSSSAIDLDKARPSDSGNYQDDAVYIGYVKDTTNGGIVRLVINDDINPANWTVSKVIDNIGPVTTSVANLLDRKNKKLWLYFAEGRYFYKQDDLSKQRRLYGVEEPCYDGTTNKILPACSSSLTLANLADQTSSPVVTLDATDKGWYINMGAAAGSLSAERVISNPTPDALGAIYFLSFSPNSDVCSFGGTSYLWALDYKTGSSVTFEMQGKALVQVSTGEIRELNLADALIEKDGRRSVGFKGIPPTGQGLMVVSPPVPIKKFIHVQEQ